MAGPTNKFAHLPMQDATWCVLDQTFSVTLIKTNTFLRLITGNDLVDTKIVGLKGLSIFQVGIIFKVLLTNLTGRKRVRKVVSS